MIALYIILAISLIALVYLFIIVFRGGNKNSQSFQRELALRNAKNLPKIMLMEKLLLNNYVKKFQIKIRLNVLKQIPKN